jgi:hypothetical protein
MSAALLLPFAKVLPRHTRHTCGATSDLSDLNDGVRGILEAIAANAHNSVFFLLPTSVILPSQISQAEGLHHPRPRPPLLPLHVLSDQALPPLHHNVQRPRHTYFRARGRANRHRRCRLLLGRRAHVPPPVREEGIVRCARGLHWRRQRQPELSRRVQWTNGSYVFAQSRVERVAANQT